MNFIEALKKCNYSKSRIRLPIVTAKDEVGNNVFIYRPEWRKINYAIKYIWVTKSNIPMASIGTGQSIPLLLEVPDFIAEDWEVLEDE